MQARKLVIVGAACLCIATAIGSGFYVIGGGDRTVLAVVIGVFALAFGQAINLAAAATQSSETNVKLSNLKSTIKAQEKTESEKRRQSEFILSQLTELRSEVSNNASLVASGFSDLKLSYGSLAEELQTMVSNRLVPPPMPELPDFLHEEFTPDPVASFEPEQQQAAQRPFTDDLLVSLEPIVDLNTGRTVHYRIHLGMQSVTGQELSHDALLQQADRLGLREQLDIFIGREAALLLRRLRQRDGNLMLFVPIGAATLANSQVLAQIMADRQNLGELASGLTFEIPHVMLAGLSNQALEGLATLARDGTVLALSNASISGLDLKALATLNVRYLSLDAGSLGENSFVSPEVTTFAQAMRISGLHLIITAVMLPQSIANISKLTRLAAGPCFAAPRRVKREIAHEAEQSFSAAA
jgi:EAL domain-containing protein (putative c-di-GMP-specific phosphodiesterase class I)